MLLVLPVSPGAAEGVGEVVGSSRLVVCHCHGPVSLIVARLGSEGTVDGYLVPVCAQSVAVSVVVREEATLEHLVRAENLLFQRIHFVLFYFVR